MADNPHESHKFCPSLFKAIDCSSVFEVLSELRPVFFSNLHHQSFEGDGIHLSDGSGFKITFRPDPSLTEYYEALECSSC